MRPGQNGNVAGSAMTWTWQSAAPSGTAKLTGVLTVGASAAPWLHAEPELNPATPSAPASFKPALRESMRFLLILSLFVRCRNLADRVLGRGEKRNVTRARSIGCDAGK